MHIIRLVFFGILSFGFIIGHSQGSDDKPFIFESSNDSIDISANFYNLYDSLTQFNHPGDWIYQNWDTYKIRYSNDSIDVVFDSIPIILQDTLHHIYYAHPFLGPITSHFGYRRYRFHYGTDIDLVTGDTVVAAFKGMVRVTTYDKGFGKVVVLRHSNGLESVYAHLSKIMVDSNTMVEAGEIIGYGGNTGRSTGSHLHFELRYLGKAIDAESIIDFEKGKPISNKICLTADNFNYLNRIKANKNAKIHYVRKGDTLSGIARTYGTSISKLCYYNGINQNSVLQIGQRIRVR